MRVLLVNPTIREAVRPFVFPIGLGIIAAVLRDAGHAVTVIDQNGLRIADDEVIERAKKAEPYDLLAAGGLVTTYKRLKHLTRLLKQAFPDIPLVLGGGVTVHPPLVFAQMPIDYAVLGEAENTMAELTAALAGGGDPRRVPGLVYRAGNGLALSASRPLERDLDRFPMPAYELFPTERYFENNILKHFFNLGADAHRIASLAWSRGCPNECTFCWRMAGRTVRFRSIDLLMEEIAFLRERYGVDGYLFVDECINASPRRARELAEKLTARGFAGPWYSHARVTNFTPDLAALLAASGCVALNFGIESGHPAMLAEMKKRATPEQASRAVAIAKAAGILPNCTFIIGMPGETESTVRASVDWIKENDTQTAGFFFATPYPGTELYHLPRTQQRIAARYGSDDAFFEVLGDAHDFIINLTDFSDEKLLELHAWAVSQTAAGRTGYVPPALAFAPEKLLQPFFEIAREQNIRRIAIYGSGAHTRRMFEQVDLSCFEIVAVIEDAPRRHGERLADVPIMGSAEALTRQPQAIVLSSDRFEEAMYEKCQAAETAGIFIYRPYHHFRRTGTSPETSL